MRNQAILKKIQNYQPFYWQNPLNGSSLPSPFSLEEIQDAQLRLERFAPYLANVFPETRAQNGLIESPLKEIPYMAKACLLYTSRCV